MIQLYGFQKLFQAQGVQYSVSITEKIKAFNQKSSVSAGRISEQESFVLVTLPHQHPEFVQILADHWDLQKL